MRNLICFVVVFIAMPSVAFGNDAPNNQVGNTDWLDGIAKVIVAITGMLTAAGILYNIVQNKKQADESKKQSKEGTDEIKTTIAKTAGPLTDKLNVVVEQTNGKMERTIKQAVSDSLTDGKLAKAVKSANEKSA